MDDLVKKYKSKWGLEVQAKIADTFTGSLFKVSSPYGDAVLKVFTPAGLKDEAGGTAFLKNAQDKCAVQLFDADEGAQLFEFLPGPNLYEFSKNGEENKASDIFVEIIKNIHAAKIKHKKGLLPLASLFKTFDQVKYPKHLNLALGRGKELASSLLATQSKEVLLHGDLHHENVMKAAHGDYVCFDPKGMIGDPAYELGTTLKNPWDYPQISQNLKLYKERVQKFSYALDLPIERIVGFSYVHLCLSILWGIEDNCDYSHQEAVLKNIGSVVSKYY